MIPCFDDQKEKMQKETCEKEKDRETPNIKVRQKMMQQEIPVS
jgi:hypothetical protein